MSLLSLLRLVFQNISWLTIECLADGIECWESDGFGLSIFEDGNIGHRNAHFFREFGNTHFSLSQHDIEIDENRHTH